MPTHKYTFFFFFLFKKLIVKTMENENYEP